MNNASRQDYAALKLGTFGSQYPAVNGESRVLFINDGKVIGSVSASDPEYRVVGGPEAMQVRYNPSMPTTKSLIDKIFEKQGLKETAEVINNLEDGKYKECLTNVVNALTPEQKALLTTNLDKVKNVKDLDKAIETVREEVAAKDKVAGQTVQTYMRRSREENYRVREK